MNNEINGELEEQQCAPNEECHHAFIRGISIENSFCPSVGDYNMLFATEDEIIYIWTHTEDKNSALVSDIDLKVKIKPFWKTIGSMITLSQAFYDGFEGVDFESRLDYLIMYCFLPSHDVESIVFDYMPSWEYAALHDGKVKKATDISGLAPLIELLVRDDKCYTALSLLFSSFQIHYCCLICELGLSPVEHESHEPALWERADFIPKMESGIVQACRCAESILGEPPNQSKQNRTQEHKRKWMDCTGINPDDNFEKVQMSYWNFYCKLFDELRNPSAHSYGKIHFDLERKRTIEAQCFAAVILRGYVEKNKRSYEEALCALSFNSELLKRVSENKYTSQTKSEHE